jgi:alpha-mannosidase
MPRKHLLVLLGSEQQLSTARLNNAWTLVMGGQFHDILPGTATPEAFHYSWNDDVIALNQFAGVLSSATEGVAGQLNTQTSGTAIVVYNPLNITREDVVEAQVNFENGTPQSVRVWTNLSQLPRRW